MPTTSSPTDTLLDRLNLDDCKARFEEEAHWRYRKIMKRIRVNVLHPVHGKIASMSLLQIKRFQSREREDFLQMLDEDEDELANFSRTLFDKFGNVRPWLVEDEIFKGTGCWGTELNEGILYYLYYVDVRVEALKGQGLGSWTLNQFLMSERLNVEDIVITWPSPIPTREKSKVQWEEETARAIAFARKNGFRRIGQTQYFAFSPDRNHPSRAILPDQDVEEMKLPSDADSHQGDGALRASLHHKIFDKESEIEKTIRDAFAEDPTSIRKRDPLGFTPLHVAAASANSTAVKVLLELGVQHDALDRENDVCLTPLMLCKNNLRLARELSEMLAIVWQGYKHEDLLVEAMLKRAMGEEVGQDSGYVQRNKWGCTCGNCIGGWLSPLMIHRLTGHADQIFDTMQLEEQITSRPRGMPIHPGHISMSTSLSYVPEALYLNIFKTFQVGYRFVFGAISQVLTELAKNPPRDLSTANFHGLIMTKLRGGSPWVYYGDYSYFDQRSVDFFFSKGGQIQFALDCIIDSLPDELEMWQAVPAIGLLGFEAEIEAEYAQFPQCANNQEIRLMRQNMGLTPGKQWGPYGEARSLFCEPDYFGGDLDDEFDDNEFFGPDEHDDGEGDDDDEEEDEDTNLLSAIEPQPVYYEDPVYLGFVVPTICMAIVDSSHLVDTEHMKRFKSNGCGDFLHVLEQDDSELAGFSRVLSDGFGNVKPSLIEGQKLRGTGCWGAELNKGTLYYLHYVNVHIEMWRDRGLGSWALDQLFASKAFNVADIVITRPRPVLTHEGKSKAEWDEVTTTKCIAFVRKNNFRRIGRTQYFGFSPDCTHPSRGILPDQDAEEMKKEPEERCESHSMPRTTLHHQIFNSRGSVAEQIIRDAFAADPSSIQSHNAYRFTSLHVTAASSNAVVVKTLLELGAQEDALDDWNEDFLTPLMICVDNSRTPWEFAEASSSA
ncbi:hypothetical protein WOLCODRAFT_143973 [Wolfiporia cocos MD-104 SS10]|uniref:Ankyrin n=1 Tax=Wolfiporia cocos (strain MD-104) TaxID=742152 RepID=A0A2H3JWS5_WOLCO|nr:hypothetical protein WOLCODRAFT_143973 [Wolfiporia cocos MD-104 SS10]